MGGNYDPEYIGKQYNLYVDPMFWPKSIIEKVELSYQRYNHYINSDHIRYNEISKYQKEWLSNALVLVSEALLKKYEDLVKILFNEIFESYKLCMKETILNYILRCPPERTRLNISLLVKPVLYSSDRIAREGGYSEKLYPEWHKYVTNAKLLMKEKLHITNIVTSSILNWYEDFSNFSLFESQVMNIFACKGFSLTISSFRQIENAYRLKTLAVLEHIFYRGAILILKKCKYLKKKGTKGERWTFNGYNSNYKNLIDFS